MGKDTFTKLIHWKQSFQAALRTRRS